MSSAEKNRGVRKEIRRRTIISFSIFMIFIAAGIWAWKKLYHAPKPSGVQAPLREVLDLNGRLFISTFDKNRLAQTFPLSAAAQNVRLNGTIGMKDDIDTTNWKLKLARNPGDTIQISMDEIRKLPKTDIVFDFKCIEGWDQITHYGGVRMDVFMKAFNLESQTKKRYMGLRTPDDNYYVGIDMTSVLHPQTILCYEQNGKPLPLNNGAPLRLIIPVKYGIKHLKRIGTMFFSDTPPRDYWAERGYDYYSGH